MCTNETTLIQNKRPCKLRRDYFVFISFEYKSRDFKYANSTLIPPHNSADYVALANLAEQTTCRSYYRCFKYDTVVMDSYKCIMR